MRRGSPLQPHTARRPTTRPSKVTTTTNSLSFYVGGRCIPGINQSSRRAVASRRVPSAIEGTVFCRRQGQQEQARGWSCDDRDQLIIATTVSSGLNGRSVSVRTPCLVLLPWRRARQGPPTICPARDEMGSWLEASPSPPVLGIAKCLFTSRLVLTSKDLCKGPSVIKVRSSGVHSTLSSGCEENAGKVAGTIGILGLWVVLSGLRKYCRLSGESGGT